MATKKIQTVTVPDPKSGESSSSYFNRIMKLRPKATDYGPAAYNVFVSEQMAFTRLATEKLSRFFPAQYDKYVQEGVAYQEGYAAARGAATPSTTTAPPMRTPSSTIRPTRIMPPATRPPTGTRPTSTTVPPTTTPPTTRPPTTTVPPTTGTTVPTIGGIFGATAPAGGTTTTEEENLPPYLPPPRYAKDDKGKWYVYEGAGLVTLDGKISEVYYDINDDPGRFYAGMTPAERLEVLGKLSDSGFYTAGDIGNYASDLNAISAWLEYSNNAGLDREAALNQIVANGAIMPKKRTGGTPRVYRTSNTDDLKVMAKKISQDTLGRSMTDEELSRFAATYQQSEIDYQKSIYAGRTTEEMQQSDIAAQEFSQELAPTEANAYKYLGYADKFFNAIGAL